jgi:hypothetical protein
MFPHRDLWWSPRASRGRIYHSLGRAMTRLPFVIHRRPSELGRAVLINIMRKHGWKFPFLEHEPMAFRCARASFHSTDCNSFAYFIWKCWYLVNHSWICSMIATIPLALLWLLCAFRSFSKCLCYTRNCVQHCTEYEIGDWEPQSSVWNQCKTNRVPNGLQERIRSLAMSFWGSRFWESEIWKWIWGRNRRIRISFRLSIGSRENCWRSQWIRRQAVEHQHEEVDNDIQRFTMAILRVEW